MLQQKQPEERVKKEQILGLSNIILSQCLFRADHFFVCLFMAIETETLIRAIY